MKKNAEDKGKAKVKQVADSLKVLKVQYVPINSVHPNPYNPNRQDAHEDKLLEKSMLEDGFTQAILVQRQTNEIIDGEHRWRKASELGFTEIPVVFTDMTPEHMRISTLRHNRARGEEDVQLTANLLRDLESLGSLEYAQNALQMDDVEIQRLIKDIPAPEALAGEEYNRSWLPVSNQNNSADSTSMTPDAVEHMRKLEHDLDKAKTDKDRAQTRQDNKVYRLNLIFTDEEADTVRTALGSRPAQTILAWCTQERLRQIREQPIEQHIEKTIQT